jgi:hypothetical protein
MAFLRKIWQVVSFLFVLYGFYLLFLFLWDTLNRINEQLALPISILITLGIMSVSAVLWVRKHLKKFVKQPN